MSIITVEVSKKYDILVEERLLSRAGEEIRARFKKAQQIMLVSDDTVNGLYGDVVTDSLVNSRRACVTVVLSSIVGSRAITEDRVESD